MCAGYGKRLNPITLHKPKPLLELHNKSLLEHCINMSKKLNIEKVKINTFYLKEKIEKFANEKKLDVEIINDGNKILDTGGGILNIIRNINEENFLVMNPDTYWSDQYLESIKKMETYFHKINSVNMLLLVNKKLSFDQRLKGDFNFNHNLLNKKNPKDYIYTGCQILNKKILLKIKKKSFSMNEIWNDLILKNQLNGFEYKNKFIHITDLEIYNKLLKND